LESLEKFRSKALSLLPEDGPQGKSARETFSGIDEDLKAAKSVGERIGAVSRRARAIEDLALGPQAAALPEAERDALGNCAADLLNRAGQSRSALRIADDVLSRDRSNSSAWTNRAVSRYQMGRFRGAIADADEAARLDPRSVRALTTRALAGYQMGLFLAAIDDARKALSIDPNNQLAHQILKLSDARVTKPSSLGLSDSQKAAADKVAREYEGLIAEGAQSPASAKAGDSAADPPKADAGSGPPGSLDERVGALLAQGRYGDALYEAERAMERDPGSAGALRNRALAREALGDIRGMSSDLRKAAGLDPAFEDFYREALKKYRLSPKAPINGSPPGPGRAAARKREPEPAGGRRTLLVLSCSLTGGLLIAFGLLHVFGARSSREASTRSRIPCTPLDSNYRILRTIGEGGMGVVYEAVDKALKRKVAVKKMRPELRFDARERERFLHEARTVAALKHPNIVEIHGILDTGGDLFLVFEFIHGRTLDSLIEKKGRLSLAEARHVTQGTAAALAYAHRQGVVHRDLKPSNIMVTDEGWVKVMDFGIARRAKDAALRFTATHMAVGTPLYMAPEQERGEVRPESDVYAYGCCLYEMLTGRRPFSGGAITQAKLAGDFVRPSRLTGGLPPGIDGLIEAALEPDPDRRTLSASEFRSRLDALCS
jgi:tetratricopeptide (TPR) repeat protein